ncbi:MAG: hypothetical protein GY749_00785 [Desulfobacteraceae bacterium]|nr:hypothetical protein [Desulfobacteraceae bacterium]
MSRDPINQFRSDDIIVEIEDQGDDKSSFSYSLKKQKLAASPPEQFDKALSIVKRSADMIEKQIKETNVDEAELTFGLKAAGEGFAYVTQGLEKANFVIKLKWKAIQK